METASVVTLAASDVKGRDVTVQCVLRLSQNSTVFTDRSGQVHGFQVWLEPTSVCPKLVYLFAPASLTPVLSQAIHFSDGKNGTQRPANWKRSGSIYKTSLLSVHFHANLSSRLKLMDFRVHILLPVHSTASYMHGSEGVKPAGTR